MFAPVHEYIVNVNHHNNNILHHVSLLAILLVRVRSMDTKHPSKNDIKRGQAPLIQQPPPIEFVELKGHSASVLCLDHSNSANYKFITNNKHVYDSTLLSGSEDGTCRLWDLRTGLRASLCIRCYNNNTSATTDDSRDVLSVSFGPPWQLLQSVSDMNAATSFARDYSVYATVGCNVYGYDLRYAKSPIITIPSNDFSILDCTDEINQIAFSPSMSTSSHSIVKSKTQQRGIARGNEYNNDTMNATRSCYLLAAADDSGIVRVTGSIGNEKIHDPQKTRNVYTHDDTALVTSIAYRPQHQSQRSSGKNKKQPSVILASGGTDCCIRLWDVGCRCSNDTTTNNRSSQSPLSSISIPQITSSDSNQVCNPPMVHCLQWSPSGQILTAGLGDGSVAIMHHATSHASLILSNRIDDAHSGTVASCLFPAWTNKFCTSSAVTANDRLLCTTGTDGHIAFWDIGENIGGERANAPTTLFPLQHAVDDRHHDMKSKASTTKSSKQKEPIDNSIDLPHTLFAFQHHAKPNWMIHSGSNDTSFPYSLFVADTSNNITIYTIPIR
jgi:WD repeat-containing protein 53